MPPLSHHRGFTLMELMIVIGTIGVLTSVVVVNVAPLQNFIKAQDAKRSTFTAQMEKAFQQYVIDNEVLPGSVAIPEGAANAMPICREGITTDPECFNADDLLPYIREFPIDVAEACVHYTGFSVYLLNGRPQISSDHMGVLETEAVGCMTEDDVLVLSNIESGDYTSSEATITWVSTQPADSTVEYGLTTSYGSMSPLDPALVTSHSVILTGLTPSTLYHYRVISETEDSEQSQMSIDFNFISGDLGLSIADLASSSVTTTTATVTWTTSIAADSAVEYGLTTSYGTTTAVDPTEVTSHSVPLTGLTSSTLYHYRALSETDDESAQSDDGTFTTDTAPVQTITTLDATGNMGQYASIALGADNLPIISYYNNTGNDLKVVKCGNAACSSGNTITTLDSTGNVGQYTSIAVPGDGLPMISYYDVTNTNLKVVKCGNASCSSGNTLTTLDSTGTTGQYTSVAIGSDGFGVISYYDASNNDLKVVKCGNAACSSGNTITTLDSTGNAGQYTSIAVGSDALPIISYYDVTNTNLKVVKCGNGSCSSGNTLTTLDSTGTIGLHTSVAVGSDGLPFIAYYNNTGNDLKVVKCGNAACSSGNTITTLDSTGNVGQYTSVAIPSGNIPVVSYYDVTNTNLKILKCGNTACSSGNTLTAVDTTGTVGQYTDIIIGSDGRPVAAYFDSSNSDLKSVQCANTACTP